MTKSHASLPELGVTNLDPMNRGLKLVGWLSPHVVPSGYKPRPDE